MSRLEIASRIVEIGELVSGVIGTEQREELLREKGELWDEYFPGRPYEQISADAWMHKVHFKYS